MDTSDDARFDIFANLPLELSWKIVGYLSFNDVLKCQAVSRSWNNALNCDHVWKRYFNEDLPDKEANFRRVLRSFAIQPCEKKHKVLSQRRILNNWYTNDFERFELSENFLLAAYDGTTLVAFSDYPKRGVFVYRVERGRLVRIQYLRIKQKGTCGLLTNTEYIIVAVSSLFIIYHLSKTKRPSYKVVYVLERKNSGHVDKISNVKDVLDGKYHCSLISVLELLRIDDDICLVNNTAFIYNMSDRVLCAWDLEKEEVLLKNSTDNSSNFRRGLIADKEQAYFAAESISVYNSQAELQYTINERLGLNSRLVVNKNLLVVPSTNSVSGFDKWTGQKVFEIPHTTNSLQLNPRLDILYCVVINLADQVMLTAYDIRAKRSIWYSICDNLLLYDTLLVNEMCIIIPSKPELFTLIDTITGNVVYSNNAKNSFCKLLLARFDIMIYTDGSSSFVNVYS